MEAAELARWTRFAAKGGIGKCIATADCVAESLDDLMFLKASATGSVSCRFLIALQQDDEITVLLQCADQEDAYLVSKLCFLQVKITRSSRRDIVKASLVDFKAMTCISSPSSRSQS